MKKFLIIGFSLTISFFSQGQSHTLFDKTFNYEFVIATYVKDAKGDDYLIPAHSKFTITKTNPDSYEILLWLWKDETSSEARDYNYKSKILINGEIDKSISNRKLFYISQAVFENNTVPFYKSGFRREAIIWSSGIVLLPIKMRRSPYTYSKDLSLGLSGGSKWRISSYNPTYLNLLFNVGISSVTIDSLSTKGKVTQPRDLATLTTSFGLVFETHAFQFGIFTGRDRLSNNDFESTSWSYNRKQWISLGLGYQILSKDSKRKEGPGLN